MMTLFELQEALCTDVERVLKDVETQNKQGERISGVKAYRRMLPITDSDEEIYSLFPYALIRIYDGGAASPATPWTVTAAVHLGVYDDNKDNRGHEHILIMMQRLMDRYSSDPNLDNATATGNIKFIGQDDETYPLYFGGVEIEFNLPRIPRIKPSII